MGKAQPLLGPWVLFLTMVASGTSSAAWAGEVSAAQAPREIGLLTCSVGQESKSEPGDQGQGREVMCRFRPENSGAEETYSGTLQIVDQAKEMERTRTIMFVVRGVAAGTPAPGLLQQTYAAEAAGAPDKQGPLVGQKSSVVLRLSPEGREEPSMALGKANRAMILLVDLKLQVTPA